MLKSRQLETELDVTSERLSIATLQLEEKEKQLAATELEMNALTRLVALHLAPSFFEKVQIGRSGGPEF